jgi:bifunctional UDP-N-acetylglucosamine pyrophosphorylase/glucosamine-1-phosphate N-acetyltransferase
MGAGFADVPKVVIKIADRPLIHYVIDYWSRFTDDFIFIVGHGKEDVVHHVRKKPIKASFIEQTERKGIAHAVLQAEEAVGEKFIVVLGDCLCKGTFAISDDMDQAIGVFRSANEADIRQGYSVEAEGPFVKKVVEKPKILTNDFCGMGFYFFRRKLFDYIRKTSPSPLRNEVEITDVIQKMIDSGERINAAWFEGDYVNINFPSDIEKTKEFLR